MDFIDNIEQEMTKGKKLAPFEVGDTIDVHYKIREGEKTRTQIFKGTVIAIKGKGIRRNFIVRRIVNGEGVERTFPVHSPNVEKVALTRRGDVRRAKLYYLRERTGKRTKVKEMVAGGGVSEAGAQAKAAAEAPAPAEKAAPDASTEKEAAEVAPSSK